MKRRRAPTLFVLVFALATVTSVASDATQCATTRPTGPNQSLCNNCTYEVLIGVSRDQPCDRYHQGAAGLAAEFVGEHIVKRAKHGMAGVSGNTVAYAPAKGYVGPDDFTIEMDFKQDNALQKAFMHFTVAVQ